MLRHIAIGAALALFCSAAAAQSSEDVPSLRVGAVTGRLTIDGVLDEPAWAVSPATSGFAMIEPRQGAEPSGQTRVRVLADASALFIGVVCEDSESGGQVSFTKQRDASLRAEDNIRIVLDTYHDGRSGYVLQINPSGARYDALINPGGDSENSNWDGIWDVATHRDEHGWSAEIWIPAQTLSFRRGLHTWYFNVERHFQRLQETDRWASPRRDYRLTQTNHAGLLTDLPSFDLGLGLSMRPAITAGGGVPGPGTAINGTADTSLDVTKRVGTNLISSLSINTDFAEAEVDTRRTNFTRFPLFFPETRTFFLEGSDVFQFGLGLGSDIVPFFSRRIGLVAGQEVPILAGAKINGRVGRTDLGAVVVDTRAKADVAPATSMGALRLKRNLGRESSLGMIATVGDPVGRAGAWSAGSDFTYQTSQFRGSKNFRVGVWGLVTTHQDAGYKTAAGIRADYPNDLWNMSLSAWRVAEGFNPALGFVPRPGVYSYRLVMTNTPRPNHRFIYQMEHELQNTLVTDLAGRWESYRVMIVPLNWRFQSGDRVEVNIVPTGERLDGSFEVADGVNISPGAYHWRRYRVEAGTANKRKLSGQLTWWLGGFYDGTLEQYILTGAWHPSALITVELSGERDLGNLPEGRFTETLMGTRGRVNISPDLQISSYIQYDTASRSIGTNTKLRWTFRPLGDLFVIYNHNVHEIEDRWRLDSNQLLVKLQYAFRR